METSHTVRCSLIGRGSSVNVTTEIDNEPPLRSPPKIRLPESVRSWRAMAYSRIQEARDTNEREIALDDIEEPNVSPYDSEVGADLLRLLFPGTENQFILRSLLRQTGLVYFDIKARDPETSSLPWEACIHADWEKLNIPRPNSTLVVVRSPVPYINKWTIKETQKLKILVAGASPVGSPTPNFVHEYKALYSGLFEGLGSTIEDRCKIEKADSITLPEIAGNRSEISTTHCSSCLSWWTLDARTGRC